MNPQESKRSWKNYLINRRVQLKVTMINLVFMGVAVLVNTAIILSSSLCNMSYIRESRWVELLDMWILPYDLLVGSLAVVFSLAIISQILLTHQFCGPLVNFTKSFKNVSQGDLSRKINLRNKDLLKLEAEQFNEMVTNLSGYIEDLKLDNQNLLQTLKEVTSDPDDRQIMDRARTLLREQEQAIKDHIDKLKLTTESNLTN